VLREHMLYMGLKLYRGWGAKPDRLRETLGLARSFATSFLAFILVFQIFLF
jgi:hypothetical protein